MTKKSAKDKQHNIIAAAYTNRDREIESSAKKFTTWKEWKKHDSGVYRAACLRKQFGGETGKDLWIRCTSHMIKKTNIVDLTGKQFGLLAVVKMAPRNKNIIYWECICNCGKPIIVSAAALSSGNTKTCGCSYAALGNKRRTPQEVVLADLYRSGCELTDPTYIYKNAVTYMPIKWFSCGHETSITYTNIRLGHKCNECSIGYTRLQLNLLFNVCRQADVNSVCEFKLGTKGQPLRLDIFMPSILLGIEIQGPKHKLKIVKKRDKRKANICKNVGIELLYVYPEKEEAAIKLVKKAIQTQLIVNNKTVHTPDLENWLKQIPKLRVIQNSKEEMNTLGKWSPKKCKEDALKFKTKTEWNKSSPGASAAARRLGIYEDCVAHMPKHFRSLN